VAIGPDAMAGACRARRGAAVALNVVAWGPLGVCMLLCLLHPVMRVGASGRGPGAAAGQTREAGAETGPIGVVFSTITYAPVAPGPSYAPQAWSWGGGVRFGPQRRPLSPMQRKYSAELLGVMWGGGHFTEPKGWGLSRRLDRTDAWLVLPWWLVIGGSAVPPAVLVARTVRRGRRALREYRGLCAGCGYDLRATPGRCPECGLAVVR
jgi:hypothetical protein